MLRRGSKTRLVLTSALWGVALGTLTVGLDAAGGQRARSAALTLWTIWFLVVLALRSVVRLGRRRRRRNDEERPAGLNVPG